MKTKDAQNARQKKFLELLSTLTLEFPVRELSRATGYKEPVISQYINGKPPVSSKFYQKFLEVYKLTEPTPPAKIPELHEVNVPYLGKEQLEKIAGMQTEYATKDEVSELRKMLIRLDERLYKLENKKSPD